MKNRKLLLKIGLGISLVCGFSLSTFGKTYEAAENTAQVQLLGINDFHGALSTTGSAYLKNGDKFSNTGGAALLASYLDRSEADFVSAGGSEENSIRVQAGDMVGASPANSALLQDMPTMLALNQMDFEVGTLGNHEFDEGLSEYNRILTGGAPGSSFESYVTDFYNLYEGEGSDMDIVIGNVVSKSDGSIPYNWKAYTTKEVTVGAEKVKIGFIGVLTTETSNLVLKAHHEGYEFLDEAETIAKYSEELKNQGVNAIVVLGHVPSTDDGGTVSGEAAEIMNKVDELYPENSVDVFFAGHNHVYTNGVVDDTLIVQSTSQGKAYSNVTGTISSETDDFVEVPTGEINPVVTADTSEADTSNIPAADADVAKIISDADATVAEVTSKKIGTAETAEAITRDVNELGESPVGNLVTDGQVYMANQLGLEVDFAMTNNGGIRADLAVESDGTITWGAAQAVQPFGNIMQIVEMTGAQIKAALNQQTFAWDAANKTSSGYFLQVSGLKYTVDSDFKVAEVTKADGTAVNDDETYRVVINDFLYGGGDGFSEFTNAVLKDAMNPDTETFIGYIEALEASGEKISASIEGRKTFAEGNNNNNNNGNGTDNSDDDPAAAAIQKIKDATKFDAFEEGSQFLTGTTIANGKITVYEQGGTSDTTFAQGTADADGKFSIDVASMAFTQDDTMLVTIEDADGNVATFTVDVVADDGKVPSTGTSDSSDGTGKEPDGKLPTTGEKISAALTLIGVLLLGGGGVVYLKNRKKG